MIELEPAPPATLFNFKERKKLQELEDEILELSKLYGKLRLEFNNLKVDIEKERYARQNSGY